MILLKNKYKTSVVIGDPHASPNHSNERFEALGNFIAANQPSNIVQMGDFMSLDSVSTFSTTKPLLREGKRLSDDLAAGQDAYNKIMAPMNKYNNSRSKIKKKKYKPSLIWHNGNHEDRVYKYIIESPELLGLVDHTDILSVEKDGWEVKKYREYSHYEGIDFSHIPMCKRMNQPISGEYVARRAADGHANTIVFGHTHRLCIHDSKVAGAEVNYGINVGWFGDYVPSYVVGNEDNCDWWSGIVQLVHTEVGKVLIMPIDMATLKREYL